MSDLRPGAMIGDAYKPYLVPDLTVAETLPARDCVVRSGIAADITLTLPSVAEAVGKMIAIQLNASIGGSKAMTLQDQDDSEDWANLTLDAAKDGVLLLSDGQKWWILVNDIA